MEEVFCSWLTYNDIHNEQARKLLQHLYNAMIHHVISIWKNDYQNH
jgi:hypothetical protein